MGLNSYFIDKSGNWIAYYRKHADLHGFLAQIWAKQTHRSPIEFNKKKLRIGRKIVRQLRELANNPPEKHYVGFHWGESYQAQWDDLLNTCNIIEEHINYGDRVYFYSWW